jgi:hypothetical protein
MRSFSFLLSRSRSRSFRHQRFIRLNVEPAMTAVFLRQPVVSLRLSTHLSSLDRLDVGRSLHRHVLLFLVVLPLLPDLLDPLCRRTWCCAMCDVRLFFFCALPSPPPLPRLVPHSRSCVLLSSLLLFSVTPVLSLSPAVGSLCGFSTSGAVCLPRLLFPLACCRQ